MRTLEKIIKPTFFQPLETNQRIVTVWKMYIKNDNLGKKNELFGILTCPIPVPSFHSIIALKTMGNATAAGGRIGSVLSRRPHPQIIVTNSFVWQLLGKAYLKGLIFELIQNLLSGPMPRPFVKNNQWLFWGGDIPVGANKRLAQKQKENLET